MGASRLLPSYVCEVGIKCIIFPHLVDELLERTPRVAHRLRSYIVLGLAVAHEGDRLRPRRCDWWCRRLQGGRHAGRAVRQQGEEDEACQLARYVPRRRVLCRLC